MDTSRWTRENLAWVAGLWEGEGCISISFRKGRPMFMLAIVGTDEDTIKRSHKILGCGHVYPIKAYKTSRAGFRHNVADRDHVYAVCAALYQYMGGRRKLKMQELMTVYKKF